jgi:hypothetical protein
MDSIQKTALKETAKTIAGLTALALLVPAAILLIPTDVLATMFGIAALVFLTKMIYDTKLAQAKFDAEHNKTVDQ